MQYRCQITCRLPRGRCDRCHHTWRVRPPWEGKAGGFSKEFEAFALMLMREMPVKKAAEFLGVTDTRSCMLQRARMRAFGPNSLRIWKPTTAIDTPYSRSADMSPDYLNGGPRSLPKCRGHPRQVPRDRKPHHSHRTDPAAETEAPSGAQGVAMDVPQEPGELERGPEV